MMKKRFHVKKRTLLLIVGIVWLIAGFNVARLGILSYRVIDRKWYLYLFSVVSFFYSGLGCALALAGVVFTRNYFCYKQLIVKEQEA